MYHVYILKPELFLALEPVTTPTTLRSQSEVPGSLSIARQRELSQQEALETAAQFHRTVGSEVPQP